MTTLETKCLGVCYIGQHIKKTGYVLLRFAIEKAKGWHVQVEPPFIPISNEEMKTRGLSLMLAHLHNIPDSNSCKQLSYFDEVTKKVMSKLKRNHVLVSVELLLNDYEELKMIPLHAGHGLGRFDTRAEEVRIFPLPMTNETFIAHLTEALEIAS
jgi:hypothetical protein